MAETADGCSPVNKAKPARDSKKPKRDDSFEAVAKRLGADEDKARFEAKLGKIATAKPSKRPTK